MLPTHSDALDLLANGGVLGFGLFALGLGMIFALAWRKLLRPAQIARPEARYGHALAWSNLGMLLGLALRAEEEAPPRR